MNFFGNGSGKLICAVLLLMLSSALLMTGCSGGGSDDGDNDAVIVCNYDDRELVIELRRDSDNTLIEYFQLDEWHDQADNCGAFNDISEGAYYLAVYEEGSNEESYSEIFHLNEWDFKQFYIDDTGEIKQE